MTLTIQKRQNHIITQTTHSPSKTQAAPKRPPSKPNQQTSEALTQATSTHIRSPSLKSHISTHPKLFSQPSSAYIRSSSLNPHQRTSEALLSSHISIHPKLISQVTQNSHQNSGYQSTSQSVNQSGQPSFSIIIIQNTPKINLNITQKHHTLSKTASIPNPLTTNPQKPERTDCQRDGCMVGTRCVGVSRWSYLAPEASDGKVLCGHKPQSKPHLSEPGTHQRTWRVMGRPARQKTQTLSMTRRNDRTRHDHAAAPLAVCPFVPPSIHPTKKEPPGPNTRELSQKQNNIIYPSAAFSAPSPTDPHAPSPSTYSPSLHSAPVQSLE